MFFIGKEPMGRSNSDLLHFGGSITRKHFMLLIAISRVHAKLGDFARSLTRRDQVIVYV